MISHQHDSTSLCERNHQIARADTRRLVDNHVVVFDIGAFLVGVGILQLQRRHFFSLALLACGGIGKAVIRERLEHQLGFLIENSQESRHRGIESAIVLLSMVAYGLTNVMGKPLDILIPFFALEMRTRRVCAH